MPHTFASAFSAKSEKVFRKNAQLCLLFFSFAFCFFRFCCYFASSRVKECGCRSFIFRLALQTFDPWFIGIIGGCGVINGTSSRLHICYRRFTLLTKNIYGTDRPHLLLITSTKAAKLFVPVVTLQLPQLLTFKGGETIGLFF